MKNKKSFTKILFRLIFDDNRMFFAFLITILGGLTVFFVLSKNFFEDELISDKTDSIKILVLITALLTAALPLLVKFLNSDKEKNSIETLYRYKREIEKQNNLTSSINEALLKNPKILDVEKTIYSKVVDNLEDSLISKLDKRFKKGIEAEFISNALITELSPLTENTEQYIDRIQRNSIVNLVIGIIGTIASITILALSILSDNTYADISSFVLHFLPRITFVVFIQLFAFFFLRLYKNNLEDAKYFQNELTNLSALSSSLKIAYITKNEKLVEQIILNLSKTERNFKLQNQETLLNIEKAKIEKDFDLETVSAFKDFLKSYRKE
ncbi:hypothetical protein [Pseudozobellia sp. WGM2]|uniref:hypothetical protein n=1 Tax=Pseudozobellia sp. WGM2 TaxID=2787625 RepID=UPI001ADFB32C|nr:hypothetical protein [Pseudozobellia sp. WGM2]